MTVHPAAPDYLAPAARAVWDDVAPQIDRWTPATTRQLAVYASTVAQYEQAADMVSRFGSFIRGKDGTTTVNPAVELTQNLVRTIRQTAADLGLAAYHHRPTTGPNETAVLRDLGDRAATAYGQLAVTLARELDVSADAVSAAAVARELRLLLVEIGKSVPEQVRTEIDELRARRAARQTTTG